MRSIEEKIDIPESRKDDFRREIMNYIGALAIEGKKFEWRHQRPPPPRPRAQAVRGPEGLDQAHQTLVSNVVDKETQEKIDIIKQRMIRSTTATTRSPRRRPQLRRQHLRPRRREVASSPPRAGRRSLTPNGERRPSRWSADEPHRDRYHSRFREIIRGRIKENLKRYMSQGS
jgi:hypothetical protein